VLRCLLLLACMCAVDVLAGDVPSATDDLLAQARPTIEAANADWVPAMKRKDAKAIASFYAEDGVLVAPNGKALQGREAVEASYAKGMTASFRFVGGGIVQDGVVLVPGPLIYEWGPRRHRGRARRKGDPQRGQLPHCVEAQRGRQVGDQPEPRAVADALT